MPESTPRTIGMCPWCNQPIFDNQDTTRNNQGTPEHDSCWDEHSRVCVYCSEMIDTERDSYDIYNDEYYCHDCSSERLSQCSSCDCMMLNSGASHNTHGDAYCEECYSDIYCECPNCESEARRADTVTVQHDEEEEWCEACAANLSRMCIACSVRTSENHAPLTSDGFVLCDLCRDADTGPDYFQTCDSCGAWYHRDNISGDGECYNCTGAERVTGPGSGAQVRRNRAEMPSAQPSNPREVINNYSFKPPPIFRCAPIGKRHLYLQGNNRLFYGIELEVTCREGMRPRAMHSWVEADPSELWYFKSDASVSMGFEAVSHPFHFEWLRANLEEFVKPIEASAACTRGYTYTSAGMHVHMSRNAFTTLHLMKFCRFFFNNPGFIMQMSRRPPDCIFSYGDPWMDKPHELGLAKYLKKDGGVRFAQRNAAINLNNRTTIECRIFRSTTTRSGVVANIEFLHGAYNFTKQASLTDLKSGIFLDWMSHSNKDFPFFNEVLLPRAEVGLEGGE